MSCLNKATTLPVRDAPVFKDPINKQLKVLSRTLFSLMDHALHQILSVTLLCQNLTGKKHFKII